MPSLSGLSARYFIQPYAFPSAVVIVLAAKGAPLLILKDRRGRAIRVDHVGPGQFWGETLASPEVGAALVGVGRTVVVFATLRAARECWFALLAAGVRT